MAVIREFKRPTPPPAEQVAAAVSPEVQKKQVEALEKSARYHFHRVQVLEKDKRALQEQLSGQVALTDEIATDAHLLQIRLHKMEEALAKANRSFFAVLTEAFVRFFRH